MTAGVPAHDRTTGPTIAEVSGDAALAACVPVIRAAFQTVMSDLGLTESDAPTNAAFLTVRQLLRDRERGARLFAAHVGPELVGCVSMRAGSRPGVVYLEKLAVAPPYRHLGYGAALMDHALAAAAAAGAGIASIGIIDQNTRLKRWYERHGFVTTGHRRFDHLPFTVCYLQRSTRR